MGIEEKESKDQRFKNRWIHFNKTKLIFILKGLLYFFMMNIIIRIWLYTQYQNVSVGSVLMAVSLILVEVDVGLFKCLKQKLLISLLNKVIFWLLYLGIVFGIMYFILIHLFKIASPILNLAAFAVNLILIIHLFVIIAFKKE